MLNREWINSRGIIFRFDRSALETRVMDEQESIKSDVALACFIRAAMRGMIAINTELLPHQILVDDLNKIIKDGLKAETRNPFGKTARQVCQHYLDLAFQFADPEEKDFLWLINHRIQNGILSEIIRSQVLARAKKTIFEEAIVDVYSKLIKCLLDNEPYL